MTMEIGSLLDPKTIEDVCRIYICAVALVRADPDRWQDDGSDDPFAMHEFWVEFTGAGHA
jgi:hypothetical protein